MIRPTRAAILVDLVVLAIVGAIQAWLVAGDFDVRLSQPPQDESPVAHAYFFAYPERFRLDAYMNSWSPLALGSLLNWFPAILFRYFSVQPDIFYVLFSLLQTALLGCALYYLARVIFESRGVAWLTALFGLMWRPHWSNSALVGGLDWMPYANWLALPCLILAIALTIERRTFAAVALLALGALIHPIMAALATLMVATYLIAEPGKLTTNRIAFGAGIGLLIGLVAYLPVIVATSGMEAYPNTIQMKVLLGNPHVNPLGAEYPYGIAAFSNSVVWSGGLFLIALSAAVDAGRQARLALLCVGAIVALTSAVHAASVLLQFAPLMNIIASRSTILVLLVSLPFVMRRLAAELLSGAPVRIISALTVIFSCSAFSLVGLLALNPPLTGPTCPQPARGLRERTGGMVALLISGLVLMRHVPGYRQWIDANLLFWLGPTLPWLLSDNRGPLFDWRLFWACAAVIALATVVRRFANGVSETALSEAGWRANGAIIAGIGTAMILATAVENTQTASGETSGDAYDYYLAQVWARDNTAPDAAFINVAVWPTNAWRGVSRRQTIVTFRVGDVYLSTSEAQTYNSRMSNFMVRHLLQTDNPLGWSNLGVEQWREFRREFGGDYLVRRTNWSPLPLRAAYRNRTIVIYALAD